GDGFGDPLTADLYRTNRADDAGRLVRLHDRPPGLAFAAAARPFEGGPPALGAAEGGGGAGHAASLSEASVIAGRAPMRHVLESSTVTCPSGRRCNSRKVV